MGGTIKPQSISFTDQIHSLSLYYLKPLILTRSRKDTKNDMVHASRSSGVKKTIVYIL